MITIMTMDATGREGLGTRLPFTGLPIRPRPAPVGYSAGCSFRTS